MFSEATVTFSETPSPFASDECAASYSRESLAERGVVDLANGGYVYLSFLFVDPSKLKFQPILPVLVSTAHGYPMLTTIVESVLSQALLD
jgi:hypothetical protein